jgi:hypothetical protein
MSKKSVLKFGHFARAAVDEHAYDRFIFVRERFPAIICDGGIRGRLARGATLFNA